MLLYEYYQFGDFIHVIAIFVLIFNIHKTQSCYSVSGLSIAIYFVIFATRYFSLVYFNNDCVSNSLSLHSAVGTIYYILPCILILFLIYGTFNKTRDHLNEVHPPIIYLICGYIFVLIIFSLFYEQPIDQEFFWQVSFCLELFAIVPQFRLIYQQRTIDKLMKYYLIILAFYRIFYYPFWFFHSYDTKYLWDIDVNFSGWFQPFLYIILFGYIYPHLKNGDKCQSIEVSKEFIKIIDTKEKMNTSNIVTI